MTNSLLTLLLWLCLLSPGWADITTGLVGHWRLDEPSGTVAADTSGTGNTGTITGAATFVAGKIGAGALSFAGSPQYVSIASHASLALTTTMTVAAWVIPTDFAAFRTIVARTAAEPNRNFFMDMSTSGIARFGFYNGSAFPLATGGSVLSATVWTHLVGTYNGSVITLYLNGASVATQADTTTPVSGGTQTLAIGRLGAESSNYWIGSIDDVRVYNRALSSPDVAELFATTRTTKLPVRVME